jgi:lambda family phage portal protein
MAFPFLNRVLERFRTGSAAIRTRALEAASPRRPWGAPIGEGIGNATIAAGVINVRQRSRHASVNNQWLANGVAAWVAALVGAGITAAPAIADATPAWNAWVERVDADGRTDLYGIQSAAARALVVDGEAFLHMLPGPAGELRVRLLAADQIDFSLTRELREGGRIVNGIEFSDDGRRVAYHVLSYTGPLNMSIAPPIRVDAADICHVFKPLFAGQVRGIPWASPILLSLGELDQLQDAQLVSAKTSAMLMGFLLDQNSTGAGVPFDGTQQGSVLTGGLEPGTIKILPSGYDIKFSSPQQLATGIDLAKLTLRGVAAGLGVPEYLLTGDLSQANYSSLRAARIQFKRLVEQVQYHVLIPMALRPIWRRWLTLEILAGRIDAAGFENDPESTLAVEWYPPAWEGVDAEKDARAEAELIAAGLKSRRQAVAERGYSIEALDREIAADRARETQLGLNFSTAPSPQTGGNNAP